MKRSEERKVIIETDEFCQSTSNGEKKAKGIVVYATSCPFVHISLPSRSGGFSRYDIAQLTQFFIELNAEVNPVIKPESSEQEHGVYALGTK